MANLNKTDFIAAVADKAGITKTEAQKAVNAVLDVITDALQANDRVVLTGFGTFEVREAKERMGVNPRTKDKVMIPATKRPAFSAGAELKKAVKGE
ncbi:MAG: HU family DNA-binding protein [Anaerolineales bacterium]|nr:HU family DNA-binding protein [Anaerolineales bacterium]